MRTVRLKHLCVRSGEYGLNIASDEYTTEGLRLIRTTDITDDGVLTSGGAVFVPPHLARGYELDDGDVLFSRSGTVGRSFVYERASHGPCAYAGYLVRFRPRAGVNSRFLYYFSKSRVFLDQVLLGSTEATISNFNADKYGSLEVPAHSDLSQRAIAGFLDQETWRIDDLTIKKVTIATLSRQRLQTSIDREIAGKGSWPTVRLGRTIELLTGFAFPSEGFTTDPDDVRLLRGVNVWPGHVDWSAEARWPRNDSARYRRFELAEGDLVMAMDRPWISGGMKIARLSRSDVPALLLQRVAKLRPRTGLLLSDYLRYLLLSSHFLSYFEPILTGISVPHISPEQIANFRFRLPPVAEQEGMVKRLNRSAALDARLRENVNNEAALLRERRQALITAAVTGQLEIAA